MGNLCAGRSNRTSAKNDDVAAFHSSSSSSSSPPSQIGAEDEQKKALEDGLRNMANGGHQMLAGLSVPLHLQRSTGKKYYHFNWPANGSVTVTSFGVKIVASDRSVEFVEGLANYATFTCSWATVADQPNQLLITLHNYKSVDANSGESVVVNTCAKKFLIERNHSKNDSAPSPSSSAPVLPSPSTSSSSASASYPPVLDIDGTGTFLSVVNLDELVGEAIDLAVSAAQQQQPSKRAEELAELRALLIHQREVMVKGVLDDIELMWKSMIQIWTNIQIEESSEENVFGRKCARRKYVVGSDAEENKRILDRFYSDLFSSMGGQSSVPASPSNSSPSASSSAFRPDVQLEKAKQLQVYNALFLVDDVRPHQCSYRKFTESSITIQGHRTHRAEFEGKRWVISWADIPELASREYMVSLFSEYANLGGRIHDALREKYLNGKAELNVGELLENYPFITETNLETVKADKHKQRLATLQQMAFGGHAMFSGLAPSLAQKMPNNEQFSLMPSFSLTAASSSSSTSSSSASFTTPTDGFAFQWPAEGKVRVCALGFTIKIVDDEVSFTQGLGTFILFDCRWTPSTRSFSGVQHAGVEVILERNVLVHAQDGKETVLPEPVKKMWIDSNGQLCEVMNMNELLSYAIETAIAQKNPNSEEEKSAYRSLLEKTQKATLQRAVWCDLAFLWSSWVQLWCGRAKKGSEVKLMFNLPCVELEHTTQSGPQENQKTLSQLIQNVVAAADEQTTSQNSLANEISVVKAAQDESYKTVFEASTIRPFECNYQKFTETEITFAQSSSPASTPKHSAVGTATSSSASSASPSSVVIRQREFKNSRHVFLWPDVADTLRKQYLSEVYQDYLELANQMYATLKAKAANRNK